MEANPSRALNVLVVEDDDATRAHIASVLKQQDHRVYEARDGLDALKHASATPLDAIVLDLVLPNVDGWSFRDVQLRDTALAHIPTLIVTVRPLNERDRYALATPFVVRKPFDDRGLLSQFNRAVAAVAPRAEATSTPVQSEAFWSTPASHPLYWSRRGRVACARHVPPANSPEWRADGWAPIPAARSQRQVEYQCQQCAGSHGPLRKKCRTRTPADDVSA
jgi:CheY-like chemotaxis protein